MSHANSIQYRRAMKCDWERFSALAVPWLVKHGAAEGDAEPMAEELWSGLVKACKDPPAPKKRKSGKSNWKAWADKKLQQQKETQQEVSASAPEETDGGTVKKKPRRAVKKGPVEKPHETVKKEPVEKPHDETAKKGMVKPKVTRLRLTKP